MITSHLGARTLESDKPGFPVSGIGINIHMADH